MHHFYVLERRPLKEPRTLSKTRMCVNGWRRRVSGIGKVTKVSASRTMAPNGRIESTVSLAGGLVSGDLSYPLISISGNGALKVGIMKRPDKILSNNQRVQCLYLNRQIREDLCREYIVITHVNPSSLPSRAKLMECCIKYMKSSLVSNKIR